MEMYMPSELLIQFARLSKAIILLNINALQIMVLYRYSYKLFKVGTCFHREKWVSGKILCTAKYVQSHCAVCLRELCGSVRSSTNLRENNAGRFGTLMSSKYLFARKVIILNFWQVIFLLRIAFSFLQQHVWDISIHLEAEPSGVQILYVRLPVPESADPCCNLGQFMHCL